MRKYFMIERRSQIYDRHRENWKKFGVGEPDIVTLSLISIDYQIIIFSAFFSSFPFYFPFNGILYLLKAKNTNNR